MRVLTFNLEDFKKEDILQNSLEKFINIDQISDLEDLEYHLLIRYYDMIIVKINDNDDYKKFLQIFKIMNKEYNKDKFSHKFIFLYENNDIEKHKDEFKKIYKNFNPEYKNIQENEIKEYLQKETIKYFYKTPDIIESFDIDTKNQIIKLKINDNTYEIKIKSKKNLNVLIYFIRHYGETVNIEMILSGISKEPEISNVSPIEASIAYIRKLFIGFNVYRPIVALKRVGYRFEI